MQHRAAIAIAVLCMLLTGCGESARVWNEGAAVKLTVSSPALVARDARLRGATYPAGYGADAWYDREQYEIRLPDAGPRNLLVALAYHELGETMDSPEVWAFLLKLASPTFPCGPDDQRTGTAQARANAMAWAEARRAEP